MCGRYVFRNAPDISSNEVAANPQWFSLWKSIQLSHPRYNIAPTQAVPVLTSQGARDMAFGVKPDWSNSHLINAKTENLLSSRYWKPMVALHPCLIPADGFYEPKGEAGAKRPWYGFEFADHRAFFMAGIFSRHEGVEQFVILTKTPNALLEPIHSRMPVILSEQQVAVCKQWLDTTLELKQRVEAVQANVEFADLHCFAVSDKAKNPRNEGKELFQAVG